MKQNIVDLEKDLGKIENRMRETTEVINAMISERKKFEIQAMALRNTIGNLRNRTALKVSDHALLRYLERKHMIPVNDVKDEIMKLIAGLPSSGQIEASGFVIKDGTVVTFKI